MNYKSFEEIDRELEILQVKRELHYQRMMLSGENLKDSLNPLNAFSGLSDKKNIKTVLGVMLKVGVPMAVRMFLKRRK